MNNYDIVMKKINTLFIVDDDAIYQLLVRKIVQSTNFVNRIERFFNGLEAIEHLKTIQGASEELPDIIFLDLFMPVMDGWGFLEEYLTLSPRLDKKITIYIISSSIDPADIEKARAINAVTDYIVKPLTEDKFISIIKSIS